MMLGGDDIGALAARLSRAPRVSDPKRVRAFMSDLTGDGGEASDALARILQSPRVRALLEGLADHSPYLWRLAERDVERLASLLESVPEASLETLTVRMRRMCDAAENDAEVMRVLRRAKQEAHLLIALADIGGAWDVIEVTQALTRFADAAISAALAYLLRSAGRTGVLDIADDSNPEIGAGVVVLAFGKHGACELNYSSDTDLVVLFDPRSRAIPADAEAAQIFVRMTKALTRLMQERTPDGYVLRVDLRLRPDPGSTSVAISTDAAMDYYESVGQNWERAAMIKARPIAGDVEVGETFLKGLAPFIWRKYFDYAAISDIHAMKRQIHAVRGHAEIAVAGHDVKLGRGGIREIEFFVQTQQLIFGGKRPQVRGARTLDMLVELSRDGWVTPLAVKDLTAAYKYLREIEHRLQMIADEQTQRLPEDESELERFARFCGEGGAKSFGAKLTRHLKKVERHYARLFEEAPGLDTEAGSLVFTGTEDDPETIQTLTKMGFQNPSLAAETVRGWHFGRRAAVQSARAREVLTELVPGLLEAFAGSGDPDAALAAFDAALMRMPAAIELMSILRSNKGLRELFADILGGAPRLAQVIAMRPHVLDAAIDPSFGQGRGQRVYAPRVEHLLQMAQSTEDMLDGLRDIAHEEKFLIGVRTLSQTIDPAQAGRAYTALADSLLGAALAYTRKTFESEFGVVPSGRCIVIGMGKLGSREMTAASDLDLILVYDFDDEEPESNGARKLHAVQYYARLTQRLVSALTVATRRGALYDVDMRLRPSGNKGPVATRLNGFVDYQRKEAETWEHMALTRARVVAGDASLAADAQKAIREVLMRPREAAALRKDVYDMRRLIASEKGEDNAWDLKLASGGVIDVEFLAQYFSLRYAMQKPDILDVDTFEVISRAARFGFLSEAEGETLRAAHRLYGAVTQMLRLTTDGEFDPKKAARGVLRRIATVAGVPEFARLDQTLSETRREVRAIFNRVLRD